MTVFLVKCTALLLATVCRSSQNMTINRSGYFTMQIRVSVA